MKEDNQKTLGYSKSSKALLIQMGECCSNKLLQDSQEKNGMDARWQEQEKWGEISVE